MARSSSDTARAYAIGIVVVAFLVIWAAIAGRPWAGPTAAAPRDPRMIELDRREAELQARADVVRRTVHRRWELYEQRLHRVLEQDGRMRMPDDEASSPPVVAPAGEAPVIWSKAS